MRIRGYINYVLFSLQSVNLLGIAISSCALWFVLPRGLGEHGGPYCMMMGRGEAGNHYYFLNWPRFTWIDIHSWMSISLAALILIHLVLHWRWAVESGRRLKNYISRINKKVIELYIAAIMLFVLFLFECLSGFIVWLVLPRGRFDYYYMLSGLGRTFWGLQRNTWVDLHAWIAVVIVSIVLVHLILNWKWVTAATRHIFVRIHRVFSFGS